MNANFKNEIQTFGRSLLLPIAVLAPVGMVMGISSALGQSYMIEKLPFLGNDIFKAILSSLGLISSVVFNNIPLLFAIGVAYGMSKKEKGIAVFASVVAYLTLLIAMHVHLKLAGTLAKDELALVGQGMVLGIQTLKIEALGGIIAGLLAAKVTDRFYRLQLPLAFAFFSGKKSVAILAIAFSIPVGLIIPFIWDLFTAGMRAISTIMMAPNIGAGIYMTLNRLLIPFGLHHVLSSTVRFTRLGVPISLTDKRMSAFCLRLIRSCLSLALPILRGRNICRRSPVIWRRRKCSPRCSACQRLGWRCITWPILRIRNLPKG